MQSVYACGLDNGADERESFAPLPQALTSVVTAAAVSAAAVARAEREPDRRAEVAGVIVISFGDRLTGSQRRLYGLVGNVHFTQSVNSL